MIAISNFLKYDNFGHCWIMNCCIQSVLRNSWSPCLYKIPLRRITSEYQQGFFLHCIFAAVEYCGLIQVLRHHSLLVSTDSLLPSMSRWPNFPVGHLDIIAGPVLCSVEGSISDLWSCVSSAMEERCESQVSLHRVPVERMINARCSVWQ